MRALGKMVVGGILATAALRFRDREAIFCAGTGRRFSFRADQRALQPAGARRWPVSGLRKGGHGRLPLQQPRRTVGDLFRAGQDRAGRHSRSTTGWPPAEIVALMRAMGAKAMLFETRFVAAAEQVARGAFRRSAISSRSAKDGRNGRSTTRTCSPALGRRARSRDRGARSLSTST